MLQRPAKEIVSISLIMDSCNRTGVGVNQEPEQVSAVCTFCRVLLVALIIYDVGLDKAVTRYDMHNAYINFMWELGMTGQAEVTQIRETERLIEELHSHGIVSGGHSTFGGRRYASLYNTDPRKAIMRVTIYPSSVLKCPNLEKLLKKRLELHLQQAEDGARKLVF